MQYSFIYFVAFGVLLLAITYLYVFQQLLKTALQYERYEIKERTTVPHYIRQLFKQPIQELKQLGFKGCCYLQIAEMFSPNLPKKWGVLLYNQDFKTYAILGIRRFGDPFNLFDIDFFTFFNNRTLLLTLNCKIHGLIGEMPKSIVRDAYTHLTEAHWQFHIEKIEKLDNYYQPRALGYQNFLKALEAHFKVYLDSLIKSRAVLPILESKLFKLSGLTALKLAIALRKANKKTAKIVKKRQQLSQATPTLAIEIPIAVEVDNFRHAQLMERGQIKQKNKVWILGVSSILFAISFIPLFSSRGFVNIHGLLLIIGVIFFHELGHFLAMKLFKYEDKSIFFLPFLGAAATGHKDEATLTEKVWVLLAGPLPGLILGIGLAIAIYGKSDYPKWLIEASWMLISINLFNLFPIYPLDGGKVADLLLFSQYPYSDVLFKVFAVVVLGVLGMRFPILFGLAIVVGWTIPLGFRSAKIGSQLQQERSGRLPKKNHRLLHLIYEKIQEFGYGKLPFLQRYQLAKNLVQRYRERASKWTTRVFLIGLYCASLFGGIVGTLHASNPQWTKWITAVQNPEAFMETILEEELEQANQTLEKYPQNTNAYIRRASLYMRLQDYAKAMTDVEQALKLDPNSASAYHIRSAVRRQMGDEEGAQEDLRKATLLGYRQQLEYADRILQQNPNSTQVLPMRAEARYQIQDYQGALEDYNRFLTLKKDNSWVYVRRGQTRYELKDYEGAIADANKAISLMPNLAPAYQLRSNARRHLGDEEGAIADEQKGQSFEESWPPF